MTTLSEDFRLCALNDEVICVDYRSMNRTALGIGDLNRLFWMEKTNASWLAAAIRALVSNVQSFPFRVTRGSDHLYLYETGLIYAGYVHIQNDRSDAGTHIGHFSFSMQAQLAENLAHGLSAVASRGSSGL